MVTFLLAFLAVTLFSLSCRQWIKVILNPIPAMNLTGYSRLALKMKRNYLITSWGVMTLAFLIALVVSFYQVYTQL